MSVFIGDPLHLVCVVENTPDFKEMTIYHKDERLASLKRSGFAEGASLIQGEFSGTVGNLEINITAVECTNKGIYKCETKTTDDTSISTAVNVAMKRKSLSS